MNITYEAGPKNQGDMFEFYKAIGWVDMLKVSRSSLDDAIGNSRHVIYVYIKGRLVGTGRIITDGLLHTYICGVGVLDDYRGLGIGTNIIRLLTDYCESNGLTPKLQCEEGMVSYYEKLGFEKYSIGMKKNPGRI